MLASWLPGGTLARDQNSARDIGTAPPQRRQGIGNLSPQRPCGCISNLLRTRAVVMLHLLQIIYCGASQKGTILTKAHQFKSFKSNLQDQLTLHYLTGEQ